VAASGQTKPTFVVYIDESGDEGFKFEAANSSTRWFVLAAAVLRKADDANLVELAREVRAKLNRPVNCHLHFRKLDHQPRLFYVGRIAESKVKVVAVLVDKRAISSPETFREESRLYFYAARYLLERVSWYCRDHRTASDVGDGSAKVVFSNRSNLSYHDLREYMARLKEQSRTGDVRIAWEVIRHEHDGICALQAKSSAGLQVADAVASSFFYAVEQSGLGYTEERYARMLKPVLYNYHGKYLGYGIKLWPREVESNVATEERFRWIREMY